MAVNFKKEFKGKRILVTGGTGSIGSAIVKELLLHEPYQVRILSRDETKQFELGHALGENPRVSFLVGDIRDKERLNLAMENVDIVFHAAALKHVPSCEKNPFEALKTNVIGTQNVIDVAFANNVEKVVGISTDKATDPTNVMGCTKLLAEKMMLSTFFYKGNKRTKFCFVRFGNVLCARGSVVPLFMSQIRNGMPVTISDPKMTRFMMTVDEAVGLVLEASAIMKDREIFVLKMPAVTLRDLAGAVKEHMKAHDEAFGKVAVKKIGRREGERIHEKLLTADEAENALETKNMFIVLPHVKFESPDTRHAEYPGARKARKKDYSSLTQKKLSAKKIKEMIDRAMI